MDHALKYTHFCMYDNNLLLKPVYMKIRKKKMTSTGLGHPSTIDRSIPFLSSPLANAESLT